jgi:hypothetical protein
MLGLLARSCLNFCNLTILDRDLIVDFNIRRAASVDNPQFPLVVLYRDLTAIGDCPSAKFIGGLAETRHTENQSCSKRSKQESFSYRLISFPPVLFGLSFYLLLLT